MSGLTPAADPRLSTVAGHVKALRVELDRLDTAVDLLDSPHHTSALEHTLNIRDEVDKLDADVERWAAGL